MFSQHPRIAERWAGHTPDMKALPEKVQKAKTAGFWATMHKLAAVDPTIRKHVERVAKRIGVRPPSAKDLDRMFPPGWEAASQGSWQAQLEKSDWLRDANSAKAHVKDVAAGRARPGAGHTTYGPGWTSTNVPVTSRIARGILRHSGLYGLGGALSMMALEPGTREVRRKARKGLTPSELADVVKKTTGRGVLIGGGLGGLLGMGIPLVANRPQLRAVGGLRNFLKHHKRALPALIGSGLLTGLYSVPWGATAGALVGSRFMPGAAEKVRERKKAAAEEEPAIPENYITKRLAIPGLLFGGASGVLEPPLQVAVERLKHFQKLKQRPSISSLFKNMPKGTGKKMLSGGTRGAIGGLLSGYLTGQFVDRLIQKKLQEKSV